MTCAAANFFTTTVTTRRGSDPILVFGMHLLRQLIVSDRQSEFDGQTVDIRIRNGSIAAIGPDLTAEKQEEVIELEGNYVSPGFVDIGPYLGDPGHEDREDLESLALAAARGGYVAVAPLPDARPARHDKSGITYLLQAARELPVRVLPLGAVSQDLAGQDITEMIDMHAAGAVAFTDGPHPIAAAGLMARALHYVKAFGGLVINTPYDASLSPHGQLHEGPVSTRLGLPGIPALGETLMLHRDLELLAYADSRLLTHLVSTAAAVETLAAARKRSLRVTASVAALNLHLAAPALEGFDTNYKVLPPLRSDADRQALISGLANGTIDCVVSNHRAHVPEDKELEFAHADFGATGLQSCFAQALTAVGDQMPLSELTARFSYGPRHALGLPAVTLRPGDPAELTVFDPHHEGTFAQHPATTKGLNNGAVGLTLRGRPVATYLDDRLRYCEE